MSFFIIMLAVVGAGTLVFFFSLTVGVIVDTIKEKITNRCKYCGHEFRFGDFYCSRCGHERYETKKETK